MCFKCGQVSHPGKTCTLVENAKLAEYISSHGVIKCPKCAFGTEKIEGCNHMTCPKCRYEYCWICKSKYRSSHFEEWNLFGCPGGMYSEISFCKNFWMKIGLLLAIPFILFFVPPIYACAFAYEPF